MPVTVKAGEVTDVGEIMLDPAKVKLSSEGQLGRIILVIAAFCSAKLSVDRAKSPTQCFIRDPNAPNRAPSWCNTKDSCSHVALPSRPLASIPRTFDPSVRDRVRVGGKGRSRPVDAHRRFRSAGVLYWFSDPAPKLRRRGRRAAPCTIASFLSRVFSADFEVFSENPDGDVSHRGFWYQICRCRGLVDSCPIN